MTENTADPIFHIAWRLRLLPGKLLPIFKEDSMQVDIIPCTLREPPMEIFFLPWGSIYTPMEVLRRFHGRTVEQLPSISTPPGRDRIWYPTPTLKVQT